MKRDHGFTLLELSILLVIIALTVGGVVLGKSIIRASELQSVAADAQRYTNAMKLFQQKYASLPGDMPNAENYWGNDAGCPETPANIVKKIVTCNGNGDSYVATTSAFVGGSDSWETFRAWQHLSNAGMIQGTYNGTSSSRVTAGGYDTQVNVPLTRLRENGFALHFIGPINGVATFYDGDYGHSLIFGTMSGGAIADGVTPEEGLQIDQKSDDGIPSTGKIVVYKDSVNCHSVDDLSYLVTVTGINCRLIFMSGL